jgi:hypothetical protein
MTRRAIRGPEGAPVRWFDRDSATQFEGATYWDGSNTIQVSTRSQWHGEDLFRTRGGRWVLYHWSRVQGDSNHYEEVTADEAAEWLALNEHEPPAELAKQHAALEV